MAEKKLSEELRHCLEDGECHDCVYYDGNTVMACRGLLQKAYEVVKRYEEMEEKGKEINLPFQTEDEVWVIDERKMFSGKVKIIEIFNYGVFAVVEKNMMYEENVGYIRIPIGNFGKTVFLTKESAEKALKEMENKNKPHCCKLCGAYIEEDNLKVCDKCALEYKF